MSPLTEHTVVTRSHTDPPLAWAAIASRRVPALHGWVGRDEQLTAPVRVPVDRRDVGGPVGPEEVRHEHRIGRIGVERPDAPVHDTTVASTYRIVGAVLGLG